MTKQTNNYYVTIEHPEFGHTLFTFNTIKEALKEASYARTHGSIWMDDLSKSERNQIMVYVNSATKEYYCKSLTKKYINYGK